MDAVKLAFFSKERENIDQLLIVLQESNQLPVKPSGFCAEEEFLTYLKDKAVEKHQVLLLDLLDSNKDTLQFISEVIDVSPKTLKYVIADSEVLFTIQDNFNEIDSLQYLPRRCSKDDLRIALRSVDRCYSNLQILLNYKSELSAYSKRLDEKVKAQIDLLHESNVTKDRFFSIIAHDLKSPFTALLGISDILINDWKELTDIEKLDLVKGLKASSENTYNLLENLLEWSRSQKEKLVILQKKQNIAPIINSEIDIAESVAQQKNISINNNVRSNLDVYADRDMISTVFRNLISNAVDTIPDGGEVNITANEQKEFCIFCVSDNGHGISKEEIIKHFSLDNSGKSNDIDGYDGIGLLLCKDFVERNGGRIWLKTKKQKGTKFFFSVPLSENN